MTDNNQNLYLDEEKILALKLAVQFWGMVSQSPKANPTSEGTVLRTADVFYAWLVK